MALPLSANIEMPILHELNAVGGSDDVRFVYERLISYFPSLSDAEVSLIKSGELRSWRAAVQKAGKMLDDEKLIVRQRGFWSLTDRGLRRVADESGGLISTETAADTPSHGEIQKYLCEIGEILGFETQTEFEYYDVVWREKNNLQRLSHVFEVQSKGNIDSAFAKLKRSHDAQRSKPFLILASERDTRRAADSLAREFRELQNILIVLSFSEIIKIRENLQSIRHFFRYFLDI